jgi:dolichyl-phosphate-mannose-protein mannosyltransferase
MSRSHYTPSQKALTEMPVAGHLVDDHSNNKTRLPINSIAIRRQLSTLLGSRKYMGWKAKSAFALLIFISSFFTRSLHAVDLAPYMYTDQQPFHGLTYTYDLRANYIMEGRGLLGPYDVRPSDTFWLARAPGYSLYLSAIYSLFHRDFYTVQLLQNAFNSLSPVLIFVIAGLLVSWRVAVVAGMLCATSHHLSHISNLILPDSLGALPILIAVLCLVIAARHRDQSFWPYLVAGIMFGAASWFRSQTILMPAFLAVLLLLIPVRRSIRIKLMTTMTMVSFLVIAPITIKNFIVYGAFVPINIGLGMVLWEGIGEASGDRFGAVATDEQVSEQEAIIYNNPEYGNSWSSPDGIARDRDRISKSVAIIVRHPLWHAGVMLKRMERMIRYSKHGPLVLAQPDPRYSGIIAETRPTMAVRPDWQDMPVESSQLTYGESIFWARFVVRPIQQTIRLTAMVFVPLGAIAIFIASRLRALFILMVPLYYLLFQSAMHTEARYTVAMQYFLFILVAVVWVIIGAGIGGRIVDFVRKKQRFF